MRLSQLLLFAPAFPLAFFAGSTLAQPQLPSTVYGSASVDGKPVPDGTEVRAFVDSRDCSQEAGLRGTVTEGGVSAFAVNVMHESQRTGCGAEGKTVTFTIGGRAAPQTVAWKAGLQRLDLNVGSGQPLPLPSVTSSLATVTGGATASAATPRAVPPGPPPTDDVTFGRTQPRSGPGSPPGESGGDGGMPVGVVMLTALAILAVVGAVAGFVLSRRG